MRIIDKRVEGRDQSHGFDVAGQGLEYFFGAYQVVEVWGSADGDVESVAGEQEVGARETSSSVEAAMLMKAIAFFWPWNLFTVEQIF